MIRLDINSYEKHKTKTKNNRKPGRLNACFKKNNKFL